MVPGSSRTDSRIALPWIIRLRFAMAAGQIATCLLVDRVLEIDLPLRWLILPPALMALSNLWLAKRAEQLGDGRESTVIGWVFVLDTLCLTAELMLAGGPNNPFSLLYLVHITLAASILNQRQTWALGALASLCFGLLFWNPLPVPSLELHAHSSGASLHLVGMWAAFTVASALVATFSGRISDQLRRRDRALLQMQEELAKKDRLASLVTLAAGAAHELSTPLGTIALVAKELEHYATSASPDPAVAEDSRLIRQEVDRCSGILRQMSLDGAEPVGEAIEQLSPHTLLDHVRDTFADRNEVRVVDLVPPDAGIQLRVPRRAIEQALTALIRNGLDAATGNGPVLLTASIGQTESVRQVRFEVNDLGSGMTPETLRRVGEPFFTTKEPGKGMGLGVFLVRTLASRLSGTFELTSEPGKGTRAVLDLPCQSVRSPVNAEIAR